jgi:hypothetical protein
MLRGVLRGSGGERAEGRVVNELRKSVVERMHAASQSGQNGTSEKLAPEWRSLSGRWEVVRRFPHDRNAFTCVRRGDGEGGARVG